MKNIYLIQYRNSDNELFENRIKLLGDWVKYFSNNWIVITDLSSKEIYEKITIGFENKSLLIIEISASNYYGRMNTEIWDFIKKYNKDNKK